MESAPIKCSSPRPYPFHILCCCAFLCSLQPTRVRRNMINLCTIVQASCGLKPHPCREQLVVGRAWRSFVGHAPGGGDVNGTSRKWRMYDTRASPHSRHKRHGPCRRIFASPLGKQTRTIGIRGFETPTRCSQK